MGLSQAKKLSRNKEIINKVNRKWTKREKIFVYYALDKGFFKSTTKKQSGQKMGKN